MLNLDYCTASSRLVSICIYIDENWNQIKLYEWVHGFTKEIDLPAKILKLLISPNKRLAIARLEDHKSDSKNIPKP